MTRYVYPSFVTVSKDAADKAKRDRFHEAAFLAALQGLCANPHVTKAAVDKYMSDGKEQPRVYLAKSAKDAADAALDQYPFITDDEQLTKGKTK